MQNRSAEREARWQAMARHRGWQACLLWPLSRVYGALMALRRWLYARGVLQSHRLPVPVIVVGNVVAGGAGKTPTVVALLRHLMLNGWKPGVVSRGYGRRSTDVVAVQRNTPADESGDEPALIHRATGAPVCVGNSRVDAAHALLQAHPEVNLLICDDGLQHLALERDLSVIVFDERGAGNGWLLPAGLLREPWPGSAGPRGGREVILRQHRESVSPPALALPQGVPVFHATRRLADHAVDARGERLPLTALCSTRFTAVAGIARPAVFFEMLKARGLSLHREVALPDHADAAAYAALAAEGGPIICTEKDAVKLFSSAVGRPADENHAIWAVPLELAPDPAFFDAVLAELAALSHGA